MFRLIENWPQLRATIVNINMDLHSLVRSIRNSNNNNNNNNDNIQKINSVTSGDRESVAECHAERPLRLDRLLQQDSVSHELQVMNAWSLIDKSPHINIRGEGFFGKRRPVAKSTDCMRGRTGYNKGLHVWTIQWPADCRGTHAMVGVATETAPLHTTGYCSLVGSNCESWGWDLVRNKCYHNQKEQIYPKWLSPNEIFDIPDEIKVVLDMDAGTVGFVVDGIYLGIAFSGLKGKKLFPVISTVWGNGEIGIKYELYLEPNPLLLKECCRQVIRNSVGKRRLSTIKSELEIPNKLKNYLVQ